MGIRERGKVIHGEDLRREFPAPTREQLVAEGTRFVGTARKHGRGGLAAAKSRSGPASSLRSKTASKLSEGVGAVKKAACDVRRVRVRIVAPKAWRCFLLGGRLGRP